MIAHTRVRHLAHSSLAIATVIIGTSIMTVAPSSAIAPLSLGLNTPTALASVGTNIWVANSGSNMITEVNSSGSLLRRVAAARYRFASPHAMAVAGRDLFVASTNNTVAEVDGTTGALVKVLSAASLHLSNPASLAVSWPDLFVANKGNSSVTEVSILTGQLVRLLTNVKGQPNRIDQPDAVDVGAGGLWVANLASNTLTEYVARTGAFVRTISSPTYALAGPAGISFDGRNIWVTDSTTNSVTEIVASTGALFQVITNASLSGGYGFDSPSTTISWHGFVYVVSPPGSSPMVTQVQASTGVANWMMCNTNYAFQFANPSALAIEGTSLWVASAGNNALVQMNAMTGALVNRFT